MSELVRKLLDGNRRALARLLTHVENEREGVEDALADLFPHTGNAYVIGITGAPGTGKSTLVSAMALAYRQQGKTVAVLAIDPTSPFSGGAILGDRIRMMELSGDKGIFIRSMATRGSLGGLAHTTQEATWVLDAAGFDMILVETVGAGQSEVDIAQMAATTLVIEAPGLGDGVQAIKAGILEIADILVVNKADRPGATNTVRTLKAMLELGHPTKMTYSGHHGAGVTHSDATADIDFWMPPVLQTVATTSEGIDELLEAIHEHRLYLEQNKLLDEYDYRTAQRTFTEQLQRVLLDEFLSQMPDEIMNDIVARIQQREISPKRAVRMVLDARRDKRLHNREGSGNTLHKRG